MVQEVLSSTTTRDVLLLRHCLRSTPNTVPLYDAANTTVLLQNHPIWNTPTYWCTEQGVEFIKQTGRYLRQQHNDNKHLRVVVDSSQRDADTALALVQGWYENDTDWTANIQYVPGLFKPIPHGRCSLERLSEEDWQDDWQRAMERLQTIPPPSSNLWEAIAALFTMEEQQQEWMTNNIMKEYDNPNFTTVSRFPSGSLHLTGFVNVVTRRAQQLFYSRASGLSFVMNHTTTTNNNNASSLSFLYQHLQWVQWYRHIVDIGSLKSATNGAVLAQFVLDGLSQQSNNNKDKNTLTILVGHDGDLDALATALDLQWELPKYGRMATPPGTGLHFATDNDNNVVQVSYLYNLYQFIRDTTTTPPTMALDVAKVVCGDDDDKVCQLPWSQLQERLQRTLRPYRGALDCWRAAAAAASRSSDLDNNNNDETFPYQRSRLIIVVAVTAVATVIALVWVGQRLRQRRVGRRKHSIPIEGYDGVEITDLT